MLVLDRRVELLKPPSGVNAIGDPRTYSHDSFVVHATVWARRVQGGATLSATERPTGPGIQVISPYTYLIRYRTDVLPEMILRDGSATYKIKQVIPRGRRAYLQVECEWLDGTV